MRYRIGSCECAGGGRDSCVIAAATFLNSIVTLPQTPAVDNQEEANLMEIATGAGGRINRFAAANQESRQATITGESQRGSEIVATL
jgi:hypothetical protein